MNDNVKRIQDCLRLGQYQSNPHACANDKALLAGEFSFYSGQLEEILQRKPAVWLAIRQDCTSDTQCDRKWEQAEDGVNEVGLKLKLKSIAKMMSGLQTLIDVAKEEANNHW